MKSGPPPLCLALATLLLAVSNAIAAPFSFTTGAPDGLFALAPLPSSPGMSEIERGHDFILNTTTAITSATLTGLLSDGVVRSDRTSTCSAWKSTGCSRKTRMIHHRTTYPPAQTRRRTSRSRNASRRPSSVSRHGSSTPTSRPATAF